MNGGWNASEEDASPFLSKRTEGLVRNIEE